MGIIGFIVVSVIVVLGSLSVGGPWYFLDIPSSLFLIGFLIGCLLISRTSIRLLWRSLYPSTLSENEIREAIRGWRSARAFAMSGGCVGALIGLVALLHAFTRPESLGPGIATALVPIFYGALFSYVVCLPVQYRLEGELSGGSMKMGVSEVYAALMIVGVFFLFWTAIEVIRKTYVWYYS